MELDQDFSELLSLCLDHDVRYLVVGGYAVAAHGHPRFTKDLDVWILVDPQNAERVVAALEEFGFASVGLTAEDFQVPDQIVQLGYTPKRVDLLTGIDGVDFESCWRRRVMVEIGERRVPFIGLDDLIANKRSTGRLQDLADVEALGQGEAPTD